MPNYHLNERSINNLKGVHPHLVNVCNLAINFTPYNFVVISGVRSKELQQKYYLTGKSWTQDSQHLIQPDGYGHAIDFAVFHNNTVTWEVPKYRKVMQAFVTAAIELGVQIRLGGLWETQVDAGHVELDKSYYGS